VCWSGVECAGPLTTAVQAWAATETAISNTPKGGYAPSIGRFRNAGVTTFGEYAAAITAAKLGPGGGDASKPAVGKHGGGGGGVGQGGDSAAKGHPRGGTKVMDLAVQGSDRLPLDAIKAAALVREGRVPGFWGDGTDQPYGGATCASAAGMLGAKRLPSVSALSRAVVAYAAGGPAEWEPRRPA
jgi:hypothetical protein